MRAIFVDFIVWYLVVQLISLAALPLALRLFGALPDRGYAFAKSLGILLVGGLLWLGTSYGLLRNEAGGAWLAFAIVAGLSAVIGWGQIVGMWRARRLPFAGGWRYLLSVECLFLVAFAFWTLVRAYDPAANHTEKPMDLMFMSGIWASPTFPPRDPWLSGYAISYYYFGYWLLITLTHLTGQLPEIAYNLGQACWFGLLWVGSFGLGYNLLAAGCSARTSGDQGRFSLSAVAGGLLSAVAVGGTGNLQGILEWLYAQGVAIDGLARFFNVRNFPDQARITNLWYIDNGWWWWRSSRVLADSTLLGDHVEVIDEFPMFSYLLGDNHPHVLAMPFVLLVVALALNLFLSGRAATSGSDEKSQAGGTFREIISLIPLGIPGLILLVLAVGGLIFLNTWDFPPYWLLITLCMLWVAKDAYGPKRAGWLAGGLAGVILVGTVIVYFPYFLTAQSQAGGVVVNFFNPTHLPQFLLMFGHFLLGLGSLIVLAWPSASDPSASHSAHPSAPLPLRLVGGLAVMIWGLPLLFVAGSLLVATTTQSGDILLGSMALPSQDVTYPAAIMARWLARPWTFLLMGGLLALVVALVWQRFVRAGQDEDPALSFALLLAAIGLLLVFAPEFIFLRDYFGSRMNTVFKFYYQGWLLLGLAGVFGIVRSGQMIFAGKLGRSHQRLVAPLFGGLALLLIAAALIYPVAGVYSKAGAFRSETPTLNSLAYVGEAEAAVIDWLRANTNQDDLVLEGMGASYQADSARLSSASGRATLLGWTGHESQWRGGSYAAMALGRSQALEGVYLNSSATQLQETLDQWQIDYVVFGPAERNQYGVRPGVEDRLAQVMDLAFQVGDYRIYRQRE